MKYVLDLKDYVTKLDSDKKDFNESFYRYYILDCDDERVATVWFGQMNDNGHIYSVSVNLINHFGEKFDIFVKTKDYYPNSYEINIYQNRFTDDNGMKSHIKNAQLTNLIAHTIMDIFKEQEHLNKYLKGRNS